ncbi:hypothetical protein BC938DRAFT_475135 [Jimgerdemannia flammicorona]|uniref:INO80 complex subunit B-like conserved region domain-containing protein n=1 Tax=Jimgerdemannia flammicorona TaxID=994334 RepID=A0A433QZE5_9FUNG|nr:hypothetical protein BC938DRAFT_475135 [Jimgerdemannia flammicorona]
MPSPATKRTASRLSHQLTAARDSSPLDSEPLSETEDEEDEIDIDENDVNETELMDDEDDMDDEIAVDREPLDEDEDEDEDDDDEEAQEEEYFTNKKQATKSKTKVTPTAAKKRREAESPLESEDESSATELPNTRPLTKRQRAKLNVELAEDFLELPMDKSNSGFENSAETGKKKHLTEEELALRRSEVSRRRKNQSLQRAEKDKTDTINRLLKKQASKRTKKDDVDQMVCIITSRFGSRTSLRLIMNVSRLPFPHHDYHSYVAHTGLPRLPAPSPAPDRDPLRCQHRRCDSLVSGGRGCSQRTHGEGELPALRSDLLYPGMQDPQEVRGPSQREGRMLTRALSRRGGDGGVGHAVMSWMLWR